MTITPNATLILPGGGRVRVEHVFTCPNYSVVILTTGNGQETYLDRTAYGALKHGAILNHDVPA